jgi:hypothetical protein
MESTVTCCERGEKGLINFYDRDEDSVHSFSPGHSNLQHVADDLNVALKMVEKALSEGCHVSYAELEDDFKTLAAVVNGSLESRNSLADRLTEKPLQTIPLNGSARFFRKCYSNLERPGLATTGEIYRTYETS